jgi:hypothetical protein
MFSKKMPFVLLLSLVLHFIIVAQPETDLLSQFPDEEVVDHVKHAFKSTRVINNHSMELLNEGALDFRILHRFGLLSDGYYQLFGLDQASMRMAFDYGINNNLMVGIGRSTSKKEVDAFFKYRLFWQSTGKKNMPVSVVWVSGVTANGLKQPLSEPQTDPKFSQRLAYYHQVIIGRKFSERFSLQVAPTFIHRNIVENRLTPNTLFGLELGGRLKLNKRLALMWDYAYAFNRFPNLISANPLGLGIDIETGGHVFQLHFSNASGMNERATFIDANTDWLKGEIRFGFNLSRIFQLKKPKSI